METIKSEKKLQRLKPLLKSIKKCDEIAYKWRPDDLYSSLFNCALKTSVFSTNLKLIYCPCKDKHSFTCDRKYSSSSEETYNSYKESKKEINKLESCGNFTS